MKLKHVVGGAGVALCTASWIALGAGFVIGVDIKVWTILVTIAAIATELMFWGLAVMLGLTVFEARRKIWRSLTRPFRGQEERREGSK
jgi:hypothetical protein